MPYLLLSNGFLLLPWRKNQIALSEGERSPARWISQGARGNMRLHDLLDGRARRIVIIGVEGQAQNHPRGRREVQVCPWDGGFHVIANGRALNCHDDMVPTWRIQYLAG